LESVKLKDSIASSVRLRLDCTLEDRPERHASLRRIGPSISHQRNHEQKGVWIRFLFNDYKIISNAANCVQ